jgi:hypothetical protein
MQALGGPSANGIPVFIAAGSTPNPVSLSLVKNGNNITISWPKADTGYTLQSATSLSTPSWQAVPGVDYVNNTVTLAIGPGMMYFRLAQ